MKAKTEKSKSVLNNVFGWVIGIPLVLIVLILTSPWTLYMVLIQAPLDKRRLNKFMKDHEGSVVLCITNSPKYKFIDGDFRETLNAKGVHRVVMFDGTIGDNKLDDFNWDRLINRYTGFPQLVVFEKGKVNGIPLKDDFSAFFRKEIDKAQLIGSIGWKLKTEHGKQRN